jgi:DNA-binding response OmpR family regulator
VLSAKSDHDARVSGLRAGADDYLTKPFYPDELLARVDAILRRANSQHSAPPLDDIRIDELRFIAASREVFFREKNLELTAMELEILECLMRAYGDPVSRDQLSLRLYHRVSAPFDRAIDTHVSRIRRKLGDGRGMILSIRGTGYQIRCLANPKAT